MIDPKLLTPEQGFVEGCVVEIEYYPHGDESKPTERGAGTIFEWNDDEITMQEATEKYGFRYMKNIRPLTGPMAIWNHAPEWANYLLRVDGQYEFSESVFVELSIYEKRPFWAKGEK